MLGNGVKMGFLLNSFCIKLVTIHLSACNFAIVHLYKEIKFKPIQILRVSDFNYE